MHWFGMLKQVQHDTQLIVFVLIRFETLKVNLIVSQTKMIKEVGIWRMRFL
jgi:hypothetical protein